MGQERYEPLMFGVVATVAHDGRLSFITSSDHRYSFQEIREAMLKVHSKLTRIIEAGPTECPFRNHQGDKRNVQESGS